MSPHDSTVHATSVLAIRRDDRTVLAADGQVTIGATVVKQGARKIRRLYNDQVLVGFAGSAVRIRSRCSGASSRSWSSTGVTWSVRRWNWRRTGAPTASCGGSRRCWRWAKP